ncbi:unnamed protein product [Caenorhabditis brenneri]
MSLLDIPDLPMIKILENCNFMSLMILRKTCHNLRNFIDYLAPETEVTSIEVDVYSNKIRLLLENHQNYFPPLDVTYRKSSQGCELDLFKNRLKKEWNDMEHIHSNREKVIKYIKDADFIDVFCMDLAVIMRNQRTELNSLKVCMYETGKKVPKRIHKSTRLLSFLGCCSRCRSASEAIIEDLDPDIEVISMCSRIYDTIEISLQPRPLRVKKLELYATGKRQLLQILPYTDPNALNCLRFYRFPYHWVFREAIDLEIDDLVKLEQWGSIKKVYICGFKIKGSIENFGHFDCVQVFIEVVTVNHVLFIKEVLEN